MGSEGGARNGTLMGAGCRLIRAFTIALEQSSYRRGGLVASASEGRLVVLVVISICVV